MKAAGVGIIGIGVHLPPTIRDNSHWSKEAVQGFSRKEGDIAAPSRKTFEELTSSRFAKIAFEELAKWKDDPFHGARERRVAAEGVLSSDIEYAAAKAALDDAALKPEDVGLLLLQSTVPDWPSLSTNPAILHHRLGLPRSCPGINTDAKCDGILFQLQLASSVIMAGGAKHALLVQSTLWSRLLDYEHPSSTLFGDAASAVVLGPVSPDRGILSIQNFMDGRYSGIAVLAPPDNAPWYQGTGRLTPKTLDHARMKEVPLLTGDLASHAIGEVLKEAGLRPEDVDLFLCHQPISSFNAISRRSAGLDHVKTVDTFRQLGAISSCVVPVNLSIARKDNMVSDGDVAIFFMTGSGLSWGAAAVRLGS